MPVITLQFGDYKYRMSPSEYILKVKYEKHDYCLSLFREKQVNPKAPDEWTFGTSFLSNFYTAFDYDNKKIGFANLSN